VFHCLHRVVEWRNCRVIRAELSALEGGKDPSDGGLTRRSTCSLSFHIVSSCRERKPRYVAAAPDGKCHSSFNGWRFENGKIIKLP
jgi:hypothetical protein